VGPTVRTVKGGDHPQLAEIESILSDVFARKNCTFYLFGSRATGDHTATSDFDIAVLADEDVRWEMSVARERLEASNIVFKVDLVELRTASKPFVEGVLSEGILLCNG